MTPVDGSPAGTADQAGPPTWPGRPAVPGRTVGQPPGDVGRRPAVERATAPSVVVRSSSYVPWGLLAVIDLHDCWPDRVSDPDTIRRFVPSVIDAIGMRSRGDLALDRFGDGELEGWSAMQFIETSTITVHADEIENRCFVDIFSCRAFDPDAAAAIATEHFGGTATVTTLRR